MDCNFFEEQIGDYLDFGLTSLQRARFAEHLLSCLSCRRLFEDISANIEILRRTTPGGRPAPLGAEVLFLPPGRPYRRAMDERVPTTIGEMVSCRTLDVIISDYFESVNDSPGSFSAEAGAVQDHLMVCPECEALFSGLRLAHEAQQFQEGQDVQQAADTGQTVSSEITTRLEARIITVTSRAASSGGRF